MLPALELAVAHSLRKKADERTPSVEAFVDELTTAIHPGGFTHSFGARTLPVSSLTIKSNPVRSAVYVDNIAVGVTRDSGDLLLEGIQSGNHHLRVTHDGFQDWLSDVMCDGRPVEVVAELRGGEGQPTIVTDRGAAGQRTVVSLTPEQASTHPEYGEDGAGLRSKPLPCHYRSTAVAAADPACPNEKLERLAFGNHGRIGCFAHRSSRGRRGVHARIHRPVKGKAGQYDSDA